jgi:hypothetical protein
MSFEVLGEKLFSSAQFSTGVRRSPNADSDSLPYILYFGNTIQYVPFQKVYAMQFRCDVGPDASKTVKTLARSALELVCAEAEKCFPGMSESKNLKHSDDRGIYSVAFMFSPEKISIPMQRLSALGTVLAEAVMKSKNGVIQ